MRVHCPTHLSYQTWSRRQWGEGGRERREVSVLRGRQRERKIVDWQLSRSLPSTSTWCLATMEIPTTTTFVPTYVHIHTAYIYIDAFTGGSVFTCTHWVTAIVRTGSIFSCSQLNFSRHSLQTEPHCPAMPREAPIEAHPLRSYTNDTGCNGH